MANQVYVLIRLLEEAPELSGIAVFTTVEAAKVAAQTWHTGTERDGTLVWEKSPATNGLECECQGLIYDISIAVVDQDQEEIWMQIDP